MGGGVDGGGADGGGADGEVAGCWVDPLLPLAVDESLFAGWPEVPESDLRFPESRGEACFGSGEEAG